MKKATKIILVVASFVLVAALSVGATIAWLTAETAVVQNTFSPSDINIELKEHTYTPPTNSLPGNDGLYGSIATPEVQKNENYKMVPGVVLPKNPFLRVNAGSESCWVFVEVIPSDNAATYLTYTVDGAVWEPLSGVHAPNGGTIYAKRTVVPYNENADQTFYILTDNKVTVNNVTTSQMEAIDGIGANGAVDANEKKPTISFYGYAVQSVGFDNPTNAWNATYGAPTQP